MANQFSSGKHSIAECDVCGFRYKLTELKPLVIKTKQVNILACPTCWDPDHPQLQLGMYPVEDPQAVRNPRRDQSYWQSGKTGLQVDVYPATDDDLSFGVPAGGSRDYQWGWMPVGFQNALVGNNIQNDLLATGQVGTVTVTTS
jgi:hypothetical protein